MSYENLEKIYNFTDRLLVMNAEQLVLLNNLSKFMSLFIARHFANKTFLRLYTYQESEREGSGRLPCGWRGQAW